jgi:hypothetical protein
MECWRGGPDTVLGRTSLPGGSLVLPVILRAIRVEFNPTGVGCRGSLASTNRRKIYSPHDVCPYDVNLQASSDVLGLIFQSCLRFSREQLFTEIVRTESGQSEANHEENLRWQSWFQYIRR